MQALALDDLLLRGVVGHPILKPGVVHGDLPPVARETDVEQVPRP
jgi:hypothetical protein